jgi:hypothetical protein
MNSEGRDLLSLIFTKVCTKGIVSFFFSETVITIIMKFTCIMITFFTYLRLFFYGVSFINTFFPHCVRRFLTVVFFAGKFLERCMQAYLSVHESLSHCHKNCTGHLMSACRCSSFIVVRLFTEIFF